MQEINTKKMQAYIKKRIFFLFFRFSYPEMFQNPPLPFNDLLGAEAQIFFYIRKYFVSSSEYLQSYTYHLRMLTQG